MNQRGRRFVYLLFGVIPACLGTALLVGYLWPSALISAAGAIGLIIASTVSFPPSDKCYKYMAVLLAFGLVISLYFSFQLFARVHLFITDVPLLAFLLWVSIGPVGCTLHALWQARRVPNPSFKRDALKRAP